MNKEQKAAVVEEVAAQIKESEAVFAVDYRGISVPQAAELREKLNEAGARFRVVKNTLTIRAAEQAGAEDLKELLEGPTAFTFVAPDRGDVALAAKALDRFRREHQLLEFKGGRMSGETLTIDQLLDLAKLPARDVLHGQLVGVVASPITGLVRGLNQLIAGFASQLQQMVDQGLVGGAEEAPAEEAAAEAPAEEAPAEEAATEEAAPEEASQDAPQEAGQEPDQEAQAEEAEGEAQESAGEGEGGEPSTEAEEPADAEEQENEAEEAPSEGENDEKEG